MMSRLRFVVSHRDGPPVRSISDTSKVGSRILSACPSTMQSASAAIDADGLARSIRAMPSRSACASSWSYMMSAAC
jgi:hypothetical protein